MQPVDPIRDPMTVSKVLFSMNPSAQMAHPDKEFKLVITTGISAPPTGMVIVV